MADTKLTKEKIAVEQIREALCIKKKQPALGELRVWIYDNLEPMEPETWKELVEIFCHAYKMSEQEVLATFRPPKGGKVYEDDFTPLLRGAGVAGWLGAYTEFTRNMEAPSAFHFFSALTILGAALQRNCWIEQGYYQVWPAVQALIVGASRKVKESTAAGYAIDLGVESGRVERLMDEGTQEALKGELAALNTRGQKACGIIYSSELSTLLGEKDYNRDLVQSLTDLFDSRKSIKRRTQKHGDRHIVDIAVSFLACSNEEWLRSAIPSSAFEGGFMARLLLVHQLGTDRVVPRPRLPDIGGRVELRKWLKRTEFIEGEARHDKKADKLYQERYIQLRDNWPKDERLSPFWNRYPDHLLRLSMLLSISEDVEQRSDVIVKEHHIEQADELLRWILDKLPRLYSCLGMSEWGEQAMQVVDFLYRSGGKANEGALYRRFIKRFGRFKLQELIASLEAANVIRRKTVKGGFDGRHEVILMRSPEEL
jgi:hypothetical protein